MKQAKLSWPVCYHWRQKVGNKIVPITSQCYELNIQGLEELLRQGPQEQMRSCGTMCHSATFDKAAPHIDIDFLYDGEYFSTCVQVTSADVYLLVSMERLKKKLRQAVQSNHMQLAFEMRYEKMNLSQRKSPGLNSNEYHRAILKNKIDALAQGRALIPPGLSAQELIIMLEIELASLH